MLSLQIRLSDRQSCVSKSVNGHSASRRWNARRSARSDEAGGKERG